MKPYIVMHWLASLNEKWKRIREGGGKLQWKGKKKLKIEIEK
jgi:hypothetical protein